MADSSSSSSSRTFAQRSGEVRPVVSDGSGPALHLPRLEERGQRLGDVVEDPLPSLLLGLQRLPALAHTARRPRVRVAEHVRMPANELLVHLARDGLEVALSSLLEQEREEVDLEEEVTQLAAQRLVISRERGVGDLVCLLDRVRDDRPLGLLAIPGALPPQLPGQVLEVEKRLREAHDGEPTGWWCRWARPAARAARSRPRS